MKLNIYLNFNGQLEEAFNFYRDIFGGEYRVLKRYKEMPHGDSLSVEDREKIMGAELELDDDVILMGCDILEVWGQTLERGNNFYINLTPDNLDEAYSIFKKLSKDGEVQMPLQKTFWGETFGTVVDKYGTQWMLKFKD